MTIEASFRKAFAHWNLSIPAKDWRNKCGACPKYVGSAYGEHGIWSRWKCYVETGHGWNDELTTLIKSKGIDYARQHFKFTLLEYRPVRADDKIIIDRETFWKKALLSRGDFGYNKN